MREPVVQLWNFKWPRYSDPVATFKTSLDGIAAAHGLKLEQWEEDGLGPARGCWCRLPTGRVIMVRELEHLKEHQPDYALDVEVSIDELEVEGPRAILREILTALDLPTHAVSWCAEDAVYVKQGPHPLHHHT